MTFQPDKSAVRPQFLFYDLHVDIGKRCCELQRCLFRVEDKAGVCEKGGRAQACRHQHAIAVDDVGASVMLFVFRNAAGIAGLGVFRENRNVDYADADHSKCRCKQGAGDHQAVAARFDSCLSIAFNANFFGWGLPLPGHWLFFSLARIGLSQSSPSDTRGAAGF